MAVIGEFIAPIMVSAAATPGPSLLLGLRQIPIDLGQVRITGAFQHRQLLDGAREGVGVSAVRRSYRLRRPRDLRGRDEVPVLLRGIFPAAPAGIMSWLCCVVMEAGAPPDRLRLAICAVCGRGGARKGGRRNGSAGNDWTPVALFRGMIAFSSLAECLGLTQRRRQIRFALLRLRLHGA